MGLARRKSSTTICWFCAWHAGASCFREWELYRRRYRDSASSWNWWTHSPCAAMHAWRWVLRVRKEQVLTDRVLCYRPCSWASPRRISALHPRLVICRCNSKSKCHATSAYVPHQRWTSVAAGRRPVDREGMTCLLTFCQSVTLASINTQDYRHT